MNFATAELRPTDRPFGACLTLFLLMTGYYALRPVRDEMGVRNLGHGLPALFTTTFVLSAILLIVTPFANRRSPSHAAGLLLFFAGTLALVAAAETRLPREVVNGFLFVWTTSWSYLLVALFWALVVDVYARTGHEHHFPFIAAGGSGGAIAGPAIGSVWAWKFGVHGLVLAAACFIGLAGIGALWLGGQRFVGNRGRPDGNAERTCRSVLAPTAAYVALLQILSTLFYFRQLTIVSASIAHSAARAAFFADLDLAANLLALCLQLFMTRRLLQRGGLAACLILAPIAGAASFVWLAVAPSLGAAAAAGVLRRSLEYAVTRPSREMLFVRIPEQKRQRYKVIVDAGVTRGADAVGAWGAGILEALGPAAALMGQLAVAGAMALAGLIASSRASPPDGGQADTILRGEGFA